VLGMASFSRLLERIFQMIGEEIKARPAAETTTIADAAKRLKIGRNQAYEAAARGEIPVIRIGRRWLVPTAALDRLLAGEAVT
jgi:excisionase family DNA binding protein